MAVKSFGVKELNLIGSSGTPTLTSSSNLTLDATNVNITGNLQVSGTVTDAGGGSGAAGTIIVTDESTDTSCNVLFTTAATGTLLPKTGTNLTFNSSTGQLTAGSFNGNSTSSSAVLHVNAGTGNATYFLLFGPSGGSYTSSLGKNTSLQFNPSTHVVSVKNIDIDGNNDSITASTFVGDLTGDVTGTMNGIPISIGNNASETDNIMIGNSINSDADIGDRNVFVGREAGNSAGNGAAYNVGLGYRSLKDNEGVYIVAIG